MGRPYKSELAQLPTTYEWALSLNTDVLQERIRSCAESSLIAIGSGGSQTTAVLVADLHQSKFGQVSKADTPLIARNYMRTLKSSVIVLVSGGGRNSDILGVARAAVESEPRSLILLCGVKNSPLARIVGGFARGFCFDFDMDTGHDGFLATNSLLALSVVALKAYGFRRDLPRSLEAAADSVHTLSGSSKPSTVDRAYLKLPNLVTLHGPQSRAAAIDLESKLTEAGLVSVQLSDYRNFAHGRHHWLAKNPNSAVLALASSDEQELAKRTLALLPPGIPSILTKTSLSGPASWVALQSAVFDLVGRYGEVKNIDPGRPGVPEFGRHIYHLNAFKVARSHVMSAAIERKVKARSQKDDGHREQLEPAYGDVCERISETKFHGLILDYDGTICDHVDRFGRIPASTAKALTRLTRAGFLLGVATGRGKSVREALQVAIAKRDWRRVWIGYYNGGEVARLDDGTRPNTDRPLVPELKIAAAALEKIADHDLKLSIRPEQVTIESRIPLDVKDLWFRVVQCIDQAQVAGVKVVTSTRSVDVIPTATTKLALLKALEDTRPGSRFLCIGDRPCWPGNDAQLLAGKFSLSVDEVDGSPTGIWNLAPAGVLGAAALRYYLSRVTIGARDFRIRLRSK